MSEQEMIIQREKLNRGLKESFMKMLELKKRLGQKIVTVDENGKTIVISAEEAEKMVSRGQQRWK